MALEGIAKPILLGKEHQINQIIEDYNLELPNCAIIDPRSDKEVKQRKNLLNFT